jgi:hypothetical protein
MRLLVLLSVPAAVAALTSCGVSGPPKIEACAQNLNTRPATWAPAARRPFVAVVSPAPGAPAVLARLDPLSLRPVSRQVEIGEYHSAWSISPDGTELALGVSSGESMLSPSQRLRGRIGIYIVDLETMKLVREVQTGAAAVALGWVAPRRLVAGLQRGGTVLVDPDTGRIIRRWPRFSFPDASASTRQGLILLLPQLRESDANLPLTRVSGRARLAVVDARGRLRSVTLARIALAVRTINGIPYEDRAGLAIDPMRGRAYVVAAGAPVAEVDLRAMRVSYHRELRELEGEDQRTPRARERRALWLGGGKLAVSGHDVVAAAGDPFAATPAGVILVDTRDWGACVLDKEAGGAGVAAGRVLTYGGTPSAARGGLRPGLHAYADDGSEVFQLFEREQVWDVDLADGLAYVRTARATHVVDVRLGKVVAAVARRLEIADVIEGPRALNDASLSVFQRR